MMCYQVHHSREVMANLWKKGLPFCGVDAVFCEYVGRLSISRRIRQSKRSFLVVVVKELEVDAALPVEVPHGVILAGPDDLQRCLIVSTKCEWEPRIVRSLFRLSPRQ